jgi:hypothetical protein
MTIATAEPRPASTDLRAALHLGATYKKRRLAFIRDQIVAGWRLKVYGIAARGPSPRSALVEATVDLAARVLPQPPTGDERSGIGFVIAHEAASICIGLVYWWDYANELHHRVYIAPQDEPAALTKLSDPGSGCVWELGIIDFERRAWLADVLANPAGPDIERYLSRRLDEEV